MVGKRQLRWCNEKEEQHGWMVVWCMRHDKRLLNLQIGDTASDQTVFQAYSAPGGQCDNMIVVLTLATNPVDGNKLGVKARATFISVETVRVLPGNYGFCWSGIKKCTKWSCRHPTSNSQRRVTEGEGVLTLRSCWQCVNGICWHEVRVCPLARPYVISLQEFCNLVLFKLRLSSACSDRDASGLKCGGQRPETLPCGVCCETCSSFV